MRLIDADEAIKKICESADYVRNAVAAEVMRFAARLVKNAPTIDPVKHGVLEFLGDYNGKCTVCNEEIWVDWEEEPKFCEHCGARFDGGKTE